MKQKNKYSVVVGNIGTMEYTSKKLAVECYKHYISMSIQNITRAAGQSVILFKNSQIIGEYIGTLELNNSDY